MNPTKKMILRFISKLKKDNRVISESGTHYHSPEDMYLNGECASLVLKLAELTNCTGKSIQISKWDNDGILSSHFIYKHKDSYYDIRGEFKTIEDVCQGLNYLDICDNTQEYIKTEESTLLNNYMSNKSIYKDIVSDAVLFKKNANKKKPFLKP